MSEYCMNCMSTLSGEETVCAKCGGSKYAVIPAYHLTPGSLLHSRYIVGKAIGEGGFGITYIGRDTMLDMRVAIKEYYPNGLANRNNTLSPEVTLSLQTTEADFEKDKAKFLNEARVLAQFSGNSGVVDVRDFFTENGTAYIVMEYIDGITLHKYLEKNGTFAFAPLMQLLQPLLTVLDRIHRQGIIHRDISPDNIMLTSDNTLKLMDFGSARSIKGDARKSLSVLLKPGYAPEEQYRTRGNQGPWTDVYSLCATIYKCITGVTPDDSMQRVFEDEVKRPSELGAQISPKQEAVLMKGMSVRQQDRYQSINAFSAALDGYPITEDDCVTSFYVHSEPQTISKQEDEVPVSITEDKKTIGLVMTPVEKTVLINETTSTTNPQPEQKNKLTEGLMLTQQLDYVATHLTTEQTSEPDDKIPEDVEEKQNLRNDEKEQLVLQIQLRENEINYNKKLRKKAKVLQLFAVFNNIFFTLTFLIMIISGYIYHVGPLLWLSTFVICAVYMVKIKKMQNPAHPLNPTVWWILGWIFIPLIMIVIFGVYSLTYASNILKKVRNELSPESINQLDTLKIQLQKATAENDHLT